MARDIVAERADIDKAVEGQTVCSLFQDSVVAHADTDALKWKTDEGWQAITWADYGTKVRQVSDGLTALGLARGEFVNIIGANRPEYYLADLGVMHSGGVPVSLYNTLAPDQISYIINHCGAVYAFVENRHFLEQLLKVRDELDGLRKVILFEDGEDFADDDWIMSFDEVLEAGREFAKARPDEFEHRWKSVGPDDLSTLIYTSGTTGPPKGVMVSHYNVCWTAESLHRMQAMHEGMTHISYLPLAHIAERMSGYYLSIKAGATCHFCPDPRDVGKYLGDVHPEFLFAVPRVWEKMFFGINAAIEANPDEDQRKAVNAAFDVSLKKVRLEQAGEEVPAEVAQGAKEAEAITGFLKALVGLDKLTIISSGAAPIAREILEWFHALGVPICEVYGQSEGTGPTSWNRPGAIRIGTVGPSIPGCEVKLLEDGELLFRGGNVTRGYYKEPQLTAETYDGEGWLHSGDIAEVDEDGYISIVDRKKEIIITAGGKNIAPSNIENSLKQCPLIGQAAVIGDRRKFVSALVVLDPEVIGPWAKARDLPTDLAQLAKRPEVIQEIQTFVDEMNQHFHSQEQIKKFTVLPDEWTAESEELTPTLKLKRKVINVKYEREIEAMYN